MLYNPIIHKLPQKNKEIFIELEIEKPIIEKEEVVKKENNFPTIIDIT